MDPDGPKTYGSYGSGSATLKKRMLIHALLALLSNNLPLTTTRIMDEKNPVPYGDFSQKTQTCFDRLALEVFDRDHAPVQLRLEQVQLQDKQSLLYFILFYFICQ
jgi:hypothetical protein